MESSQFSHEAERYMIEHMNAEHADANLLYVQVYGQLQQATAARMIVLDKEGMELEVTVSEGLTRVRIPFVQRLRDEKDAERTLVAMALQARQHSVPATPKG